MPEQPSTITVNLKQRSYDIIIGNDVLANSGAYLRAKFGNCTAAIITDDNVRQIFAEKVARSLQGARIKSFLITIRPGEQSKNFTTYQELCEELLSHHLTRHDLIIALGGGVIGDLAGFAASTVNRGMRLVQMPTTLLAQVDSSIGGKTAINTTHGKNLVGTFYQPQLVLSDVTTLESLAQRQFASGYGEIIKYAVINNPEFFTWLEANQPEIFAKGKALKQAIITSCQTKADIVTQDEFDIANKRILLNLGHTFGHALEASSDYSNRLFHGEGVAIGICMANRFSASLGYMSADEAITIEKHIRKSNLPTRIIDIPGKPIDHEQIINHIYHDKKNTNGNIMFILTKGIGQAFATSKISRHQLRDFLAAETN